jgi:hypothetical protein
VFSRWASCSCCCCSFGDFQGWGVGWLTPTRFVWLKQPWPGWGRLGSHHLLLPCICVFAVVEPLDVILEWGSRGHTCVCQSAGGFFRLCRLQIGMPLVSGARCNNISARACACTDVCAVQQSIWPVPQMGCGPVAAHLNFSMRFDA